jgi:hypothetical protein
VGLYPERNGELWGGVAVVERGGEKMLKSVARDRERFRSARPRRPTRGAGLRSSAPSRHHLKFQKRGHL